MLSAENNQTWTKIFSENGMQYREPKIVLFENVTQSGCGTATSYDGTILLPTDETVYMDMSFFGKCNRNLALRVTEFTVSYVLAHEIGHHIRDDFRNYSTGR